MFKMNDPILLEFCRVRKQFGPVIALNDVSFSVRAGEVHCLVGENGAGKSTLIKILAGAYSIDGGELRIDGKPVRIETPAQAAAYGISVVYQDVTNVDKLSIADNIVLGAENSRFGFNQKKKNIEFVRPFLSQVGLEIEPTVLMESLSILLNRTLLGKYAYAIGGNSETARLSGIKVNLVRCVLYILTALMSFFVGILMSSRINSGDPNLSTSGIEFEIIVAIILGGTSLLGGQGSLIGTLIGALILGNLSNGMNLLGIGTVYQFIVEGAVLVVAVVLDLTLKGNGLRIKKLRRSN